MNVEPDFEVIMNAFQRIGESNCPVLSRARCCRASAGGCGLVGLAAVLAESWLGETASVRRGRYGAGGRVCDDASFSKGPALSRRRRRVSFTCS